MNKDIIGFSRDIGDYTPSILALRKVFRKEILEDCTRNEVVEILQSEPLFSLSRLEVRFGGGCKEGENGICLLEIVEFFDVDYSNIIRRRLRNLGVTKFSLLTLFDVITKGKKYDDLISFVENISRDDRFLQLWTKIEFVVEDFYDLLYLFNIESVVVELGEEECEMIPVILDDKVFYEDFITKFENFRSK